MTASHQTVRLGVGRHRSQHAGACAMELASMLAGEPFSDRPPAVSPVIGAFLRTYNDGLDEERRQDLLPVSAAVVGTGGSRAADAVRIELCLEFARRHRARLCRGRGALALATPEAAGAAAAQAVLARGPSDELHAEALAFLHRLATGVAGPSPWRPWRRRRPPAPAPPPPAELAAL